jgi:hypothetical protein
VPVEEGQCYRLAVRENGGSSKAEKLLLQLNWKNEDKNDIPPQSIARLDRSRKRWRQPEMIVRAPSGSKYAVVHAGATGAKIWVDDFSLKKISGNCIPELSVTPNVVSVAAGQRGRAAVSWNACCSSEGRVTLSINGGAEEVFARGQSGLEFLDGMKPGMRYVLRLYTQPETAAVQTATLKTIERTATIAADPNPVPAKAGLGRTRISWATLGKGDAEVFVSRDDGPEQLLARGPTGSVEVDWIAPGSSYEFRLYSRDSLRQLLAKTVVK